MIPLVSLLEASREAGRPVAFGREGERSLGDLQRDVGCLAARLGPVAGRDLLLHCDDAYAFAVGLLAAARVGARAILPPSRQPGALRRLAPDVAGALVDGDPPAELGDGPCWHPLDPGDAALAGAQLDRDAPLAALAPAQLDRDAPLAALAGAQLDRDAPLAALFTSGTTGAGRPVEKALRHLDDEIAVLEGRFGTQLGAGTRVLATVAPQHLYGLLFRVLWPLAAGRPFLRSAPLHPEELASHSAAGSPFAVVTTPAALRHWVERGELSRRRDACRAVFSSGGPLAGESARRAAEVLGAPPWEVYGSTETGGVAVRQQRRGGESWTPLPGVELASDSDGCLVVTSPFVSVGEALPDGRGRTSMGDRVRFDAAGRFELLGRADRVLKVGEKRLELPEMESRLLAHPAVGEAVLIALEKNGGETRVGAVVVPAAESWEVLATSGRRALAKTLTEHLAPDYERVLLPRAWRFVAALPRDAQGKLPAGPLRALFDSDAAPRAPERLGSERGAAELELRLRVPWDLAFLDGHFPARPLVAGAVQVHWVLAALEELTGRAPELAALEALKFREALLPGQELTLRVELADGGARFRFSLADAERIFSSGRGRLGRAS